MRLGEIDLLDGIRAESPGFGLLEVFVAGAVVFRSNCWLI
jgi:hypothetical protein